MIPSAPSTFFLPDTASTERSQPFQTKHPANVSTQCFAKLMERARTNKAAVDESGLARKNAKTDKVVPEIPRSKRPALKSGRSSEAPKRAENSKSGSVHQNDPVAPGNVLPLAFQGATIVPLPSSSPGMSAAGANPGTGSVEGTGTTSNEPNGEFPEDTARQREQLLSNLRAAMLRLEDADGDGDENDGQPSNIIPFPGQPGHENRIIPVQFRPASGTGATAADTAEPQLPTVASDTEKSAGSNPQFARLESPAEEGLKTTKTNAQAYFLWDSADGAAPNAGRGTSTARRERNMDSRLASAQFDPAGDGASLPDVSSDTPGQATGTNHPPAVEASATHWPSASTSPWNAINEVSPDITTSAPAESAGRVEQINKLVGRETLLFRQHTSDSMAVVLRPDAHTELFLHLSRRDGQIEASVRCERGDFHQLNAHWQQLQETLAHQKVRLNPLLESSSDSFAYPHSNNSSSSGRDETSRQSRADHDYMDEWPAPASPDQEPAHVRSRRESGHRLSTSRPGWETWA
jgi:hypothetical protein